MDNRYVKEYDYYTVCCGRITRALKILTARKIAPESWVKLTGPDGNAGKPRLNYRLKGGDQLAAAWRAETSARAQPGRAPKPPLLPLVTSRNACRCNPIEQGIDETHRTAQSRMDSRDQRRRERSNRAGSSADRVGTVGAHQVTGQRIRISGDIGHTARSPMCGVRAGWHRDRILVGRLQEERTDSASAGATGLEGEVVPHGLTRSDRDGKSNVCRRRIRSRDSMRGSQRDSNFLRVRLAAGRKSHHRRRRHIS